MILFCIVLEEEPTQLKPLLSFVRKNLLAFSIKCWLLLVLNPLKQFLFSWLPFYILSQCAVSNHFHFVRKLHLVFLCKFSVICEACCRHETNNIVNYQFINQGMKDLSLKQRQIIFWGFNKKIRFNCTLQCASRIIVISFISSPWYS